MPDDIETITWIAQFQDKLTEELESAATDAQNAWHTIGAAFQQGAGVSVTVSDAISASMADIESVIAQAAGGMEGFSPGEWQEGAVRSAGELLAVLQTFESLSLGDGVEELAGHFDMVQGRVVHLQKALKQLAFTDPDQFAQFGKAFAGFADQLSGIPKVDIAVQAAGAVPAFTGETIAGFLIPAIEGALEKIASRTGAWIAGIFEQALELGAAAVTKDTNSFFVDILRGATRAAQDQSKRLVEVGVDYVAKEIRDAGKDIAGAVSDVTDTATGAAKKSWLEISMSVFEPLADAAISAVTRAARGIRHPSKLLHGLGLGLKAVAGYTQELLSALPAFKQISDTTLDWFRDLGKAIQVSNLGKLGKQFLGALGPMQLVSSFMQQTLRPITEMAMGLLEALAAPFEAITGILSTALVPVFRIFQAILTPIARVLSALIEPLTEFLVAFLEPIAMIIELIMDLVGPFLEFLMIFATGPMKILTVLFTLLLKPIEMLVKALQPAIEWLNKFVETARDFFTFQWALDALPDWIKKLLGIEGEEGGSSVADADPVDAYQYDADLGQRVEIRDPVTPKYYQPHVSVDPDSPDAPRLGDAPRSADAPRLADASSPAGPFNWRSMIDYLLFGPEEKGITAKQLQETMDGVASDVVLAIRRTELDPDNWIHSDPIVARLAQFQEDRHG